MKNLIFYLSIFFFLTGILVSCYKKCIPDLNSTTEVTYIPEDSITFIKTYRDDVPTPPTDSWSTLDTSNMDLCQSRLWEYLSTFYPTREENYWNYNMYSIMDEPDELYANRAFLSRHIFFFGDTIWSNNGLMGDISQPCRNVDSTFFLQAIGQPTIKSYAGDYKVTYFYFFDLKYRRGPCPNIFNIGSNYEYFGQIDHFDHCSTMRISFLQDSGKMVYIDFFGT